MPDQNSTLRTEYGRKNKERMRILDRGKRILKNLWVWWTEPSKSESLLYRPISYVPFLPPPATLWRGEYRSEETPIRGEEEVAILENLNKVYRKTEGVVERKIGSAIILVPLRPGDPQNPHIFSLEGIGEDIWQLIDGQRSVGEIFEILSREFAVKKSQLFIDLLEFLEQLKAIGGITE